MNSYTDDFHSPSLFSRIRAILIIVAGGLCLCTTNTFAAEDIVKNDSLTGGDTGTVLAPFIAGESAAAWLTADCDGDLVAVQIYWRSQFGGASDTIEESITIFDESTFPTPGASLRVIPTPTMQDGVYNEYRLVDAGLTPVPVNNGQTFVVSLKFFNTPGNVNQGPGIVLDSGCQAGKNAAFAQSPNDWINACDAGLPGDLVIRAVIDCAPAEGVPAASDWGLAVMTILILIAGTFVMRVRSISVTN